jgi:hypothetical protein
VNKIGSDWKFSDLKKFTFLNLGSKKDMKQILTQKLIDFKMLKENNRSILFSLDEFL